MKTNPPLLANIRSQARNLARINRIKLASAYEIIAWVIYHCPNYQDLLNRLSDTTQTSRWFVYAALCPSSPASLLFEFKNVVPKFVERLSSRLLCNTNRFGLTKQIYQIFGLTPPDDVYESLFPQLNSTGWKLLDEEHHDSSQTLNTYVKVNGVTYRLIAVNLFMPEFWPNLTPTQRQIASECSPISPDEVKLMTGGKDRWLESFHKYVKDRIQNPDDDHIEFEAPNCRLSNEQVNRLESIQQALELSATLNWPEPEYQAIPMAFNNVDLSHNSYYVFGYPVKADVEVPNCRQPLSSDQCAIDDSQVFYLDGYPLLFEWAAVNPETMEHTGEYTEHFNKILKLLERQVDFSPELQIADGHSQLALFMPAHEEAIRQSLKAKPVIEANEELWFIKVENSDVAEALVRAVEKHELFKRKTPFDHHDIVCNISLPTTQEINLALSFEVESNKFSYGVNLVSQTEYTIENDRTRLLITISNELIQLIESFGASKIINTFKFGLVNHEPLGTIANIQSQPVEFVTTLAELPNESDDTADIYDAVGRYSLDELWRNTRLSQFERDAF